MLSDFEGHNPNPFLSSPPPLFLNIFKLPIKNQTSLQQKFSYKPLLQTTFFNGIFFSRFNLKLREKQLILDILIQYISACT